MHEKTGLWNIKKLDSGRLKALMYIYITGLILMETGEFLLMETGDKLIVEYP